MQTRMPVRVNDATAKPPIERSPSNSTPPPSPPTLEASGFTIKVLTRTTYSIPNSCLTRSSSCSMIVRALKFETERKASAISGATSDFVRILNGASTSEPKLSKRRREPAGDGVNVTCDASTWAISATDHCKAVIATRSATNACASLTSILSTPSTYIVAMPMRRNLGRSVGLTVTPVVVEVLVGVYAGAALDSGATAGAAVVGATAGAAVVVAETVDVPMGVAVAVGGSVVVVREDVVVKNSSGVLSLAALSSTTLPLEALSSRALP
mmetsp:Transcript_63606/g.182976  ORF Transcript_63606/g.182976 Transcript_63606/m.182976 type:complete len:268 (-) Transcript_63606:97-900(-)